MSAIVKWNGEVWVKSIRHASLLKLSQACCFQKFTANFYWRSTFTLVNEHSLFLFWVQKSHLYNNFSLFFLMRVTNLIWVTCTWPPVCCLQTKIVCLSWQETHSDCATVIERLWISILEFGTHTCKLINSCALIRAYKTGA